MLGSKADPFDQELLAYTSKQIAEAHHRGVKVGVVVGAGNLIRGRAMQWLGSISADQCGMVATVINGIVIHAHLQQQQIPSRLRSGIAVSGIVQRCSQEDKPHYDAGTVLIFVGGTGNPLFTTDTAAALRAAEFDANIVIKATKVEGVHSADPEKTKNATMYKKLRYAEAIAKDLKIMDLAAFDLCRNAGIPICVYNFTKYPLTSIVEGQEIGTLVTNGG
jgi:uridylate kinase